MSDKLNIIVAGGGRVGFETTKLLSDHGHDLTVIEPDEKLCETIMDEYTATVIQGDASRPSMLRQADLGRADVIAALTGSTGLNLAICMISENLNPEVKTVARIEKAEAKEYTQLVDEIVFPEHAGARIAANEILGSDIKSLMDVTGKLDILDIEVAEGAPAAGRKLKDVKFPVGALVISSEGGHKIATPTTELTPHERYIVAVDPDVVDEVLNLLRG